MTPPPGDLIDLSPGSIHANGHALWEDSWGKIYPVETLHYQGSAFHFYKTQGALKRLFRTVLGPRMLIREEYHLAYDYFDQAYQASAAKPPELMAYPNFVMTGQSGIGTPITFVFL
jgi:hypothetical protein